MGGGLAARGREARSSGGGRGLGTGLSGRGAWSGRGPREPGSQGGVAGLGTRVSQVGLGVPGGSQNCYQ